MNLSEGARGSAQVWISRRPTESSCQYHKQREEEEEKLHDAKAQSPWED